MLGGEDCKGIRTVMAMERLAFGLEYWKAYRGCMYLRYTIGIHWPLSSILHSQSELDQVSIHGYNHAHC
jgi:hypothetical protein